MKRTWLCLALLTAAGGCNSVLNGVDNGCCDKRQTASAQNAPASGGNYQYVGSLGGGRTTAPNNKPLVAQPRPAQIAGQPGALPNLQQPPVPPPAASEPIAGQPPMPSGAESTLAQAPQEYKPILETQNWTMRNKPQAPPPQESSSATLTDNKPAATSLTDARLVPVVHETKTPAPASEPKVISAAAVTSAAANPEVQQEPRAAGPAVRLVNTKRIHVNYEVKDVGPSGVAGVELWYTQDSRTWKKFEGALQKQPPYVVEVTDEGLYGFTLVARSGAGLSKQPPQAGDLPQVWVEVDTTKPTVKLIDTEAGFSAKAQNLIVRWTASDKNLAAKPITISYAEQTEGPWTPLATNLENNGRYVWQLPASVPKRLFVRVEAADTVGNVGLAQSPQPLLIDLAQPTVAILGVEPVTK
jgi:hypothetical protein